MLTLADPSSRPITLFDQSIYIRAVSLRTCFFAELVYGPFGQSNIHCTVHLMTSKEGIECTKAKAKAWNFSRVVKYQKKYFQNLIKFFKST